MGDAQEIQAFYDGLRVFEDYGFNRKYAVNTYADTDLSSHWQQGYEYGEREYWKSQGVVFGCITCDDTGYIDNPEYRDDRDSVALVCPDCVEE